MFLGARRVPTWGEGVFPHGEAAWRAWSFLYPEGEHFGLGGEIQERCTDDELMEASALGGRSQHSYMVRVKTSTLVCDASG